MTGWCHVTGIEKRGLPGIREKKCFYYASYATTIDPVSFSKDWILESACGVSSYRDGPCHRQ